MLLEDIIADFRERPLPSLTPREARLPALKGKIDAVIGMRRSGKTWFLYQRMQALLDQGIAKDRLLYINFDDERLLPMRRDELSAIPEVYYRLYPHNRSQTCYFFCDEIQNVDGWESFLRRLLDSEDMQLAVTGSSARLLSREIATSLRGRALATEIFPFSFREALRFQGVALTDQPPGGQQRALLANRLRDYLLVKTREIIYLLFKQPWAPLLPILQGLNGREMP
ncbi:MAG TPA: AAA family ATPase [Chromatiaceae bacterium]|nr:AAA family ATPase [Chromatiaceae bacterium]